MGEEYVASASKLGKPMQLFHGTRLRSAHQIATRGFKLPKHSGLYGPGIYFAHNPRKSANYAPESSWSPFFRRWANQGFYGAISNSDEGQLLLSDVYLGNCKREGFFSNTQNPATDLAGGWFRKLFGMGDYDSVYAPGW